MDLKIKHKLFLSFVVTILFTVLILSVVNYNVSALTIKENTLEQSKYTLNQISVNLENKARYVDEKIFAQYKDQMLYKYVREGADADSISFSNALLNFFNYLEPYVQSALIVDQRYNEHYISRDGQPNPKPDDRQRKSELEGELRELWGAARWAKGSKDTVYLERALYDIETTKYIGYLIVGVDAQYLADVYNQPSSRPMGDIIVLNSHKEPMLYKEDTEAGIARQLLAGELPSNMSGAFISSTVPSPNNEWILLNRIPVKDITGNLDSLRYWSVLTFAAAVIAASVLALLISSHISGNVKLLLSSIRSVSKGDFEVRIRPRGKDEVGLLAEEFNRMSEKIRELMEQVKEEQTLKQQAEYRMLEFQYNALQAQMNPHFLYNTLESINSLAKISGNKEISKLVIALGNLLRESIRKKSKFVTLEEELEYVKNYLSIYKIIYEDRLEVRYECDLQERDTTIPNFILQPIVENCIVHGIEKQTGNGLIHIRIYAQDAYCCIEIEDNGVGMTEDQVEALRRLEDHGSLQHTKHTRVGIRSVAERLMLIYGTNCRFEIQSVVQQGTTVRLTLPLHAKVS
ncbi:sensor histidine kinase [Paenibacillus thalictri]|nr:histidine kinase [Paenibacillus thalictri]